MKERIHSILQESIRVKQSILDDPAWQVKLADAAEAWIDALKGGGKVLFCGNGGSAADAQHLAAELSGRFYVDRDPLPAEALHVNTSYLTAVANDYSYDEVYARMVKGMGRKGDVLVAISTSGNSSNILRAIEEARIRGMVVIGMTGDTGGKMAAVCDHLLNVPSSDTPRIQEVHILLGHILCELTEARLFSPS
ncbi:MAG: D-sedoheptulose 7-phosphate isomerase [Saprospiraceae bacterium]|nr:D-sedoheptulose 7-phosphate isomerase [Saprospiraceae bacterium]HRW76189.1 D-sedoheptulose 7-phosphate isomerase [Saprospiraceae bacterium]